MTFSTKHTLLPVLAAAALTFFGAAAQAHPSTSLTEMVSYADLNLETDAGTKVLYRRLRSAAHVVCRPLESRSVTELQPYEACLDEAMSSAVAAINRPRLSALHSQTRHNA